jgi:hypothetical protein
MQSLGRWSEHLLRLIGRRIHAFTRVGCQAFNKIAAVVRPEKRSNLLSPFTSDIITNINDLSRFGKHLLVRANLANIGRHLTATIGQGTEIGVKIITPKLSCGEVISSIPACNYSKKAELKRETCQKTWKRFVQIILYERPDVLLENPESIFYELCMNTGRTQFEVLAAKARAHSVEKEHEEED